MNSIYTHERNEKKQADATISCLNNRNKHAKHVNPQEVYNILKKKYGDGLERQLYMSGASHDEIMSVIETYAERSKSVNDCIAKLMGQKSIKEEEETTPLFNSEQERHDLALECSYCLGESFIENEGDLDDIYYAVLKIFDSTCDAPASTNYDDILNWCRKYYKDIESLIM